MKKQKPKKSLASTNFQWEPGFNIIYSSSTNCEEYGCSVEGICRCSTIKDAKVTEVGDIVSYFVKLNDFDRYCIDRLLVARKIWDTDNWEVRVCGGYYGQEIEGVFLRNAEKIENEVTELLKLSDSDKIKYVLNLEYGYILDVLENKTFEICEVNKTDIVFGQEGHYKKLNKDIVEKYQNYELPRGVCVWDDLKYRVIDGYHRISACQDKKIKIILAKEIG